MTLRIHFVVMLFLAPSALMAQLKEIPLGQVSYPDLEMKIYPKDSSANAVVLNEYGQAHISTQPNEGLIFEHYLKIKILNRKGFDEGNFVLRLKKNDKDAETVVSVVASTFNLENGLKKETKMDPKNVFKQDDHKYSGVVKFTLPDIREGSVIEVLYKINSPFYFNFRPWSFQTDIPKVHSEYWALIPANYIYNISLRGFYKLTLNESSLVNDCYEPGVGNKASCALLKYGMDDVPAFVRERYMTAASNFISAIHFELSEMKFFDGHVNKITKEWKDVDDELRQSNYFGVQIKKAENLLEDKANELVKGETDELKKAKIIFQFIKDGYLWNETYGIYTDVGVKKAFEDKRGNTGDINLSLVGALRAAGLHADPIILSTRDNGLPVELFPVMTEFNYVIGSVEIGDKRYFLDATHRLHSFGFLPLRCLNGKGRLMTKESSWIELKPKDKKKTSTVMDLGLTPDGIFEGKVIINYQGYDAFSKRVEMKKVGDTSQYQNHVQKTLKEIEILHYTLQNLDDLEKPIIETLDIRLNDASVANTGTVYFNPFLFERIKENPFKARERLYPVDFGAPMEVVYSINLKNLGSFNIDELPSPAALTLPDAGGRFLFNVSNFTDRITIASSLSINRPVYNSAEYHFLKELYARIVQIQQSQIVLKRK